MIYVRRSREPPVLRSKAVEQERNAAGKFFAPRQRSAQRSFSFRAHRHPEVVAALRGLFHDKCAYCETPAGATPLEIEQHRPRERALNLDGLMDADHYWWLALEWTNLLPVCIDCLRSKGTRFPVDGPRIDVGGDVKKERALLIDPCREHPERHLVFSEDGQVHSATQHGQTTIEILSLNRTSLVVARAAAYGALGSLVERTELTINATDPDDPVSRARLDGQLKEIRSYLKPEQPYGAMLRQFVNRWLQAGGFDEEKVLPQTEPLRREAAQKAVLVTEASEREAVQQFSDFNVRQQSYSVEAEAPAAVEAFYSGAKRLEWFEIENFKGIEQLRLEFPKPTSEREPWLMVLGENGTGKSSILQALALALMGEQHSKELGLDASRFVRAGAKRGTGTVRVKLTNIPEPIVLRYRRSSRDFTCETPDPKVLLLGYGATRLLRPRVSGSDWGTTYIRVKNLFDPTAPLDDVESWLLDRKAVDKRRFDTIARALSDLLMLATDERLVRGRSEIDAVVGQRDGVPLRQLSDGFQSVVALATDIMKILLERWPTVEDAEGIVLLDEIEAHLHPTWKIEIVERLRRTFPRVAFIVSTHDPLCLKGLQTGETVLLRRDERRRIVADTNLPSVNDLRADQILTSVLFGLHSTRGDETATAIDRYAELLSRTVLTQPEKQEREQLKQRLAPTLSNQESDRQVAVEQAIWQTLISTEALSSFQPLIDSTGGSPEIVELRRQLGELLGPEGTTP